MNDLLFSLGSLSVAPFWILMIVAPRWSRTERIARSPLIAIGPAVIYAVLALPEIATLLPAVARPTLSSIAVLLGAPDGALLAWMHFLAFDVFVGRWVYLDARARGVPAWVSSPALFFVLMLGPLGLLAYLGAARFSSTLPSGSPRGGERQALPEAMPVHPA